MRENKEQIHIALEKENQETNSHTISRKIKNAENLTCNFRQSIDSLGGLRWSPICCHCEKRTENSRAPEMRAARF